MIYNKIKTRIYHLIRDDGENNLANSLFNGLIIFLIIINVSLVILETLDNLPAWMYDLFQVVELISVMIFIVEYILRLWTSDYLLPNTEPLTARLKYVFSFMAMVDLLAILPFFLPLLFPVDLRVLRMVRLLRILRILKVNRYTSALSTVAVVIKRQAAQLIASMFVVAVLIIMSSVLMYNIESSAQPEVFKNAFSGMWWAIATLTTVGYGDIYPVTVIGKCLSAVIALLGIGLVAVPTGIISAGFIENISDEQKEEKSEKHYCAYCGHNID